MEPGVVAHTFNPRETLSRKNKVKGNNGCVLFFLYETVWENTLKGFYEIHTQLVSSMRQDVKNGNHFQRLM